MSGKKRPLTLGKLRYILLGLFLLLCVLFPSRAIAFDPNSIGDSLREGINYFTQFYRPFIEAIVGQYSTDDFLFAKTLMLILLFVVIRSVMVKVPKIGDNKAVAFIVALVISIFAVRYISDNQLTSYILTPYGVTGIAILTIIPFLAFFWFVHKSSMSSIGRRLFWILFFIIYCLLFFNRYPEMNSIGRQISWAVLALMVLSFMLDRQIRKYFALSEIKGLERQVNDKIILDLLDQLEKAEKFDQKETAERIRKHLRELGVKKFVS